MVRQPACPGPRQKGRGRRRRRPGRRRTSCPAKAVFRQEGHPAPPGPGPPAWSARSGPSARAGAPGPPASRPPHSQPKRRASARARAGVRFSTSTRRPAPGEGVDHRARRPAGAQHAGARCRAAAGRGPPAPAGPGTPPRRCWPPASRRGAASRVLAAPTAGFGRRRQGTGPAPPGRGPPSAAFARSRASRSARSLNGTVTDRPRTPSASAARRKAGSSSARNGT